MKFSLGSLQALSRVVAALGAALFAAAAVAQEYPSKPIRVIVAFPPGGVADTVARLVAAKLPEALGQPGQTMVIENRSGAGGVIGTDLLAKSAPDGYTLGVVIDTHAVNPHIYRKLPFDTFSGFAPVSLAATIPLAVMVNPSLPASSLKELAALAKSRPGALSYGSPGGAGTAGHLAAEQFKLIAGIDIVHVPYKGGAPAIADLLGGQVQLAIVAASGIVSHTRSGKLRALAVSGARRSPALPEVPTAAEAGFPQLDSGPWTGFLAPAGTPPAIVARLSREIARVLKDPAVSDKLTAQTMEIVGSTPEQFAAIIRAEHDKWGKLIKDANLNISQ